MYASILFVLLFIVFVYVGTFSLKDHKKNNEKVFRLLSIGIRGLQFSLIIIIFLLCIDLMIFVLTGDFNIIYSVFINDEFSSVFNLGEPILVALAVATNFIYLSISEITYGIVLKMKEGFRFSKLIILKIRLISKLLILFVLVRFVFTYVQTSLFTFRFDSLFLYMLLVILIRIFEHGVNVQEDSDLSI